MRADYQVEVLVTSYQNPSGRRLGLNETCCDGGRYRNCSSWRHCDNYFSFCLRELGAPSSNSSADCPLGRFDTTTVSVVVNHDDLTFEEGETALNAWSFQSLGLC